MTEEIKTRMAILENELEHMNDRVALLERVIFGLVGLVLIGVMTAIMQIVINGGGP